jgi:tetratricopeptide (TPR) repeat protein
MRKRIALAGGAAAFLQKVEHLDEQSRGEVLLYILRSSFSHDPAETFLHETEPEPEPVKVKEPDLPGALQTARSFTNQRDRDFALGLVAVAQARGGRIAQSLVTAQTIGDGKARYFALRTIGREQALAGLAAESAASFNQAVEIARKFEANPQSSEMRDGYLSQVAIAQANAGQIAEARRTILAIEGNQSSMSIGVGKDSMHNADYERRWALYHIARAEAKAGNLAEAIPLARSLSLPGEQLALGEGVTAEGLAEGGRIGMLLANATPERWRADALSTASKKCAVAGRFADALQIAAIVDDLDRKARVLAVIGQLQARAGLKAEAAQAFAEAVRTARSIRYEWRVTTLVFVAGKMPE